MSIWDTLGVAETADRDTIRRAYARKLRTTNPEDDADGFKVLRAAYESALAHAEWTAKWGAYAFDDDEDESDLETPAADDAPAGEAAPDTPAVEDLDDLGGGDVWRELDVAEPRPAPDWSRPAEAASEPGEEPAQDSDFAEILAMRDADLEQLRALMAELDMGLRGPWRPGDAVLEQRLFAILDAPAMGEIRVRDDVGSWLADLLASTIPQSDAVLKQSIDAFGWDGELHTADPSVAQVLERLEEWRIIAALNHHSHPYHGGWRSLTGAPGAYFLWRIDALRPSITRGAAALLGEFGPVASGLHFSFKTDSVERWQAFLAKPRLTLGMLAQMPVLLIALLWIDGIYGKDAGLSVAGLIAAIAIGCIAPVVSLFVLAPMQRRWAAGYHDRGLATDGWPFAFAGIALLGTMLPGVWPGLLAVPAWGIAAWAYVVKRRPQDEKITVGDFALIGGLAFFLLVLNGIVPAVQLFAVTGWAVLFVHLRYTRWRDAREILDQALERFTPTQREWILLGVVIAGLGAAFGVTALREAWAPTALFYPAALCILAVAMLSKPPEQGGGPTRRIGATLLGLMLLVAFVASVPKDNAPPVATPEMSSTTGSSPSPDNGIFDAADAEGGMQALERNQPAFAQIRTNDPELYSQLRERLAMFYDGRWTRETTRTTIEGVLNSEYRARLPDANAGLLVEGERIHIAVLKALRKTDPGACADEGKTPLDTRALPPALQARRAAQVFNIIGNPPATQEDRDAGRPVSGAAMMDRVAEREGISRAELSRRLAPGADAGDRCKLRIALLGILVDESSQADAAATIRAELKP